MRPASNECSRMLKDIGIIGFVLVELILYLDTHPYDKQAMEYFNHYSRIQAQLRQEFSARFYPLSPGLSQDSKEWSWALAPMPWEGGF